MINVPENRLTYVSGEIRGLDEGVVVTLLLLGLQRVKQLLRNVFREGRQMAEHRAEQDRELLVQAAQLQYDA